jgi:phosphohistidine phosphatase
MPCTLVLLRHGIAAEAKPGAPDAERALTEEGARKTTNAAIGLGQLDVAPDVVLTSPLRRAEETARIACSVLAPRLSPEIYLPLGPGHDPREVVDGLRAYRDAEQILLVGHQPDLGELASHLLTGATSLVPLPFKKAGAAAIALASLPPRRPGVLEWFVTPMALRAIARSRG